jgi:transposase-like protein
MAQFPDSRKERLWLERIRRWQPSRLSVREYCQRRGLSEPSFYAWRRLLRQRGLLDEAATDEVPALPAGPAAATPAFVKVTVKAANLEGPAIDVVLGAERIVRVRAGFDPDLLRQLLRLLEEPSC